MRGSPAKEGVVETLTALDYCHEPRSSDIPKSISALPAVPEFQVTSTDLKDGQPLDLAKVNAHGDTSPQLSWSGAPEGTQSYVVTCFDPDAPIPSGFWHWAVVDIPADVTELDTGAGASDASLPAGFHLRNDAGDLNFVGAASPQSDQVHRYYFVVHAVSEKTLGIDAQTSPAVVGFKLAFSTLGRAIIMGTYHW